MVQELAATVVRCVGPFSSKLGRYEMGATLRSEEADVRRKAVLIDR